MSNADEVQDLFERVRSQLDDIDVDIEILHANLHTLVRSGHVCAAPLAVRILVELLTNERRCPSNWPLALD